MQEGAASESSPRNAHVVQGLGRTPFLEGFPADRKQGETTALAPGAHDHAPLVLDVVVGAAATRHGLEDLDLFAGTGVLDKMADVDDALVTDVRSSFAFGGWVRFGCGRVIHGGLPDRLSGSRGALTPAGPFPFPTTPSYYI
jgi:hypothetical protein